MSSTPNKKQPPTLTNWLLGTEPRGTSKGDFTLLMMAIQTAVKVTEKYIRQAGLSANFGYADQANASGDDQAKLDVISNDVFKLNLACTGRIFVLGSEEEEYGCIMPPGQRGCYLICFDPLDGSSNIDANVSVGSIWGIWKVDPSAYNTTSQEEITRILLQKGSEMVSSGYAMYGSATNLVLTCGEGVQGFTLDASIGEFIQTHFDMRIGKKRIYSCNEGNYASWEPWFRNYIDHVKNLPKPYTARYIGSMVADVHRTILYGGVFAYPMDTKNTTGKLRYLYEAAPMAFLIEQAGGIATTGTQRILDIDPSKLHQRVPVFLGSAEEINLVMSFKAKAKAASKL
jgi:fructose-1,6-bisphosphatase I